MKKKTPTKTNTKLRKDLYTYYICGSLAGVHMALTGLFSLMIYPIPNIGIPICFFFSLVWILCCHQVYFVYLKKHTDRQDTTEKTAKASASKKVKVRTGIVFSFGIVILILGNNLAFPFWLRSILLAVTVVCCICAALWSTQAYQNIYLILTQKED